jgi:hypothetical protein
MSTKRAKKRQINDTFCKSFTGKVGLMKLDLLISLKDNDLFKKKMHYKVLST